MELEGTALCLTALRRAGARDVTVPCCGALHGVITGPDVPVNRGEVETVPGAVDDRRVRLEQVVPAPAAEDLVGLEAVLVRVAPCVALDQVAVALGVDPAGGALRRETRPVEGVADQGAAGGALLDVDALRGGG